MRRLGRLFEIIQILRQAKKPITALQLAEELEVHPRTVYRDIATLQATRVPIEGAAGLGYVMRSGFDLPPLMFGAEEIESILVGLSLVSRTGDLGLQKAAETVKEKIAEVLPESSSRDLKSSRLKVSKWGAVSPFRGDLRQIRQAIREERKLHIHYQNEDGVQTARTILPLALIYYVESNVVASWCELRRDYRHFRADRISQLTSLEEFFPDTGTSLRADWQERLSKTL